MAVAGKRLHINGLINEFPWGKTYGEQIQSCAEPTNEQQRNAIIAKAKELEINQTEDGFADLIVGLAPLKTHPPVVPLTSSSQPPPTKNLGTKVS